MSFCCSCIKSQVVVKCVPTPHASSRFTIEHKALTRKCKDLASSLQSDAKLPLNFKLFFSLLSINICYFYGIQRKLRKSTPADSHLAQPHF